jgi:hypothetical protein
MHSLGASVKTLGGATAQSRLIVALAIEARNDCVGNLFDKLFEVAVGRVLHRNI